MIALSRSDKQSGESKRIMNIIKLKKLKRLEPKGGRRCRTPACCGSGAKLKQLNVSRTSLLLHCLLARMCVCVWCVCEEPSRCLEAVLQCMNQSVCHHLVTKKTASLAFMLITRVFSTFCGARRGLCFFSAVVLFVNNNLKKKKKKLHSNNVESLREKCWRFVFASLPSLPPLLFRFQ